MISDFSSEHIDPVDPGSSVKSTLNPTTSVPQPTSFANHLSVEVSDESNSSYQSSYSSDLQTTLDSSMMEGSEKHNLTAASYTSGGDFEISQYTDNSTQISSNLHSLSNQVNSTAHQLVNYWDPSMGASAGSNGRGRNRQINVRLNQQTMHTPAMVEAVAEPYSRKDRSLGLLCDKFFAFCRVLKDGLICLNEASAVLNVERRRIYDVTNILEALDIVSRRSKNQYLWHGTAHLSMTLKRLRDSALQDVGETRRVHSLKKIQMNPPAFFGSLVRPASETELRLLHQAHLRNFPTVYFPIGHPALSGAPYMRFHKSHEEIFNSLEVRQLKQGQSSAWQKVHPNMANVLASLLDPNQTGQSNATLSILAQLMSQHVPTIGAQITSTVDSPPSNGIIGENGDLKVDPALETSKGVGSSTQEQPEDPVNESSVSPSGGSVEEIPQTPREADTPSGGSVNVKSEGKSDASEDGLRTVYSVTGSSYLTRERNRPCDDIPSTSHVDLRFRFPPFPHDPVTSYMSVPPVWLEPVAGQFLASALGATPTVLQRIGGASNVRPRQRNTTTQGTAADSEKLENVVEPIYPPLRQPLMPLPKPTSSTTGINWDPSIDTVGKPARSVSVTINDAAEMFGVQPTAFSLFETSLQAPLPEPLAPLVSPLGNSWTVTAEGTDVESALEESELPSASRLRVLPLLSELLYGWDKESADAVQKGNVPATAKKARREMSLAVLTQRFVKIFLLDRKVISLDFAASIVVNDSSNNSPNSEPALSYQDLAALDYEVELREQGVSEEEIAILVEQRFPKPEPPPSPDTTTKFSARSVRTSSRVIRQPAVLEEARDPSSEQDLKLRARRLYDIVNVLCALRLVERVHVRSPENSLKKPAYRWRGPAYVEPVAGIPLPDFAIMKLAPTPEVLTDVRPKTDSGVKRKPAVAAAPKAKVTRRTVSMPKMNDLEPPHLSPIPMYSTLPDNTDATGLALKLRTVPSSAPESVGFSDTIQQSSRSVVSDSAISSIVKAHASYAIFSPPMVDSGEMPHEPTFVKSSSTHGRSTRTRNQKRNMEAAEQEMFTNPNYLSSAGNPASGTAPPWPIHDDSDVTDKDAWKYGYASSRGSSHVSAYPEFSPEFHQPLMDKRVDGDMASTIQAMEELRGSVISPHLTSGQMHRMHQISSSPASFTPANPMAISDLSSPGVLSPDHPSPPQIHARPSPPSQFSTSVMYTTYLQPNMASPLNFFPTPYKEAIPENQAQALSSTLPPGRTGPLCFSPSPIQSPIPIHMQGQGGHNQLLKSSPSDFLTGFPGKIDKDASYYLWDKRPQDSGTLHGLLSPTHIGNTSLSSVGDIHSVSLPRSATSHSPESEASPSTPGLLPGKSRARTRKGDPAIYPAEPLSTKPPHENDS